MEFLADALGLLEPSGNVFNFVKKGRTDCDSESVASTAATEFSDISLHGVQHSVRRSTSTFSLLSFNKADEPTDDEPSGEDKPNNYDLRLAKEVVKQLPNGDLFSGLVDTVSGDLIRGRRTYSHNGEVYEGPFSEGKRDGAGAVSTRLDGSKFLGSYRNDHPYEGTLVTSSYTYQGRLLLPSSSSSGCAVTTPIFHGPHGHLAQRSGHVYEGDFSHGKFHGCGAEQTASGLSYRGDYNRGKWHGVGELSFERRSRGVPCREIILEEGKDDVKSYTTADFNPRSFRYAYLGEWQHGEREGKGVETIIFGRVRNKGQSVSSSSTSNSSRRRKERERRTATYDGEFQQDRRHGFGTLTLPDGTILEGEWRAGFPVTTSEADGCTSICSSSSNLKSIKEKPTRRLGRRRSKSRVRLQHKNPRWHINLPNGNVYWGECTFRRPKIQSHIAQQDDSMRSHLNIDTSMALSIIPHGHGTMVYGETSDEYTGQFRLGKRHGSGKCTYSNADGEVYDGTFIDDLPAEIGERETQLGIDCDGRSASVDSSDASLGDAPPSDQANCNESCNLLEQNSNFLEKPPSLQNSHSLDQFRCL